MVLAWLEANKIYKNRKYLTFVKFPNKFVKKVHHTKWKPRKYNFRIRRLIYVPPNSCQLYYLRIYLTNQKSYINYDIIKCVNEIKYKTYQEVCYAMKLVIG